MFFTVKNAYKQIFLIIGLALIQSNKDPQKRHIHLTRSKYTYKCQYINYFDIMFGVFINNGFMVYKHEVNFGLTSVSSFLEFKIKADLSGISSIMNHIQIMHMIFLCERILYISRIIQKNEVNT